MAHKFVILLNNELKTYYKYEDIPESFDNLIKFLPEIPDGPHTEEQHAMIEQWNERMKELRKRETR